MISGDFFPTSWWTVVKSTYYVQSTSNCQLACYSMYASKVCNRDSKSVELYVAHFSLHRHLSHKRYPCGISSCQNEFPTYHLTAAISQHKHKELSVRFTWEAFSCGETVKSVDDFNAHLKLHLQDGSRTTVTSQYDGCKWTFRLKSSFVTQASRFICPSFSSSG